MNVFAREEESLEQHGESWFVIEGGGAWFHLFSIEKLGVFFRDFNQLMGLPNLLEKGDSSSSALASAALLIIGGDFVDLMKSGLFVGLVVLGITGS